MGIIDSILGRPATQSAAPVPASTEPTVTETNPLDAYKSLHDNEGVQEEAAPSFNIDTEALQNISGKLNFIKDVNPELLSKASSGDAQAMITLINVTAQQAYQAALKHTTTLTDEHLSRTAEHRKKEIQSGVRESLIQQEISTVPNATHPVVQQELARIARDFARRSPEASPAQIKAQAIQYFNDVHNAVAGPKQPDPKKASEVDDWESFLTN